MSIRKIEVKIMNKRQKIIVSITGIFIVLLALVGLTYAYFLTQIRGNEETKSISISTANLILEYGDGNGVISLSNILPGDPSISMRPKDFIVTNRGNETVENYNVYLENVINQLELKDDFQYNMTCVQVKTTEYEAWLQSPDEELSDIAEKVEKCNGVKTFSTFPSVMSVIATNTINPGYTHYYVISLKYIDQDYDQSIDMNKQVSAKINIYDGKTKFLATEILNNAKSNTSTKYVEPNMLGIEENTTVPGTVVSLENEKILSYTLDNLGTSYYYRGNVDDNYVNFAGMCWRIVRIEGDGSVKLILEDQYTTCDDTTDSDGEGTEDYAYTGNWSIGTGHYGYNFAPITNSSGEESSGYYYLEDYINSPTDTETSMRVQFDTWLENSKIDVRKLKKTKWYLYNQTDLYDEQGILFNKPYLDLLNDNVDFYYDLWFRINTDALNKYASLKHNEEKYKIHESYIGAINADEVLYAGGMYKKPNKNYYLINDLPEAFWTISSIYYYSVSSSAILVNGSNGGMVNRIIYANGVGTRPSISLISTSTVTTKSDIATNGQPGSITNPYEVN